MTRAYDPERLGGIEGARLEFPRHTGRALNRVLDFSRLNRSGENHRLEQYAIPGFSGNINDLVSYIFSSELDSEGRDWRGDRQLSRGEIQKLKEAGEDIHELKGQGKVAQRDLYKDRNGNIYVKPKGGQGPGEPTGLNINDYL